MDLCHQSTLLLLDISKNYIKLLGSINTEKLKFKLRFLYRFKKKKNLIYNLLHTPPILKTKIENWVFALVSCLVPLLSPSFNYIEHFMDIIKKHSERPICSIYWMFSCLRTTVIFSHSIWERINFNT